ncbi:MAG: sialate O-acetylesterase, partial [Bacteroidota bacterium]|nr:sialate O-acetylesterase [Bacteroidota bacterium]
MKLIIRAALFLFFTASYFLVKADVKLSLLFRSNMVMQRDKPCNIWGTADNGEVVTISFNGKNYSAKTFNGKWKVTFAAQAAGGPYQIIIKGKNTIELNNVLFGDVWICGGQSNMQFSVREAEPKPDTTTFNDNNIRLFTVGIATDFVPQDTVKGGSWKIANVKD